MLSPQLRAEANAWLIDYNHHRANHGAFMHGRTPALLATHKPHDPPPQDPPVTSTPGQRELVIACRHDRLVLT